LPSPSNQLTGDSLERRVPLGDIGEHLSRLEINGITFDADWDLDHRVVNPGGPAGDGRHRGDKASPDCVLVSVNGPMPMAPTRHVRPLPRDRHLVFDALVGS
jgi:hypothetical protein